MKNIINIITNAMWSWPLVGLCLAAGLFFSIMTRFAQVRHFLEMWRLLFKSERSEQGISSFQALAVSLSGRVGMGNIAGVAAAIGFGGAGAIFWMWIVAFLGASTAYVESTLGQIYKERGQVTGQYRGGPAYYFEKCLNQKWYAIVFAISSIIACGIFLPGPQANGVVNAVTEVFGEGGMVDTSFFGAVGINRMIGLAVILFVLGFIIFGGIKRIANFTQVIVPFMALGYIIMALIIVFANIDQVPHLLSMIVHDAWSAQAGFGAAIGWGVKRGIYSNEAGQGTGPHAASAAEVEHPAQQGLVQAFSVYVDTLFVCTATALMILITSQYNIQNNHTALFTLDSAPQWMHIDTANGTVRVDKKNYNFNSALAYNGKKINIKSNGTIIANIRLTKKTITPHEPRQITLDYTTTSTGKIITTSAKNSLNTARHEKNIEALAIVFTQRNQRVKKPYGKVEDVIQKTFLLSRDTATDTVQFTPTRFLTHHIASYTEINSPAFTQKAVSSVFGNWGKVFIAVAVFFFAFTTILAYYYIAEVNIVYLSRFFTSAYGGLVFAIKVCVMVAVAYGALNDSGYIWGIGDIGVGMMAWLNIVGILLIFFMGKPAIKALYDYERQQKEQIKIKEKKYFFNPRKLGIKNANFWEDKLYK